MAEAQQDSRIEEDGKGCVGGAAADVEPEREGCALEQAQQMSQGARRQMRLLQLRQIIALGGLGFVMVSALVDGRWGVLIGYVVVCLLPATIRTIMDWKYDTMGLQGSAKKEKLLKHALLNFSQWRIFYDASECVKVGAIGMSLNMSLIVFSLLRQVPMLIVHVVNLILLIRLPVRGSIEIISCVYICGAFLIGGFGVGSRILDFEVMTNAEAAAPKKKQLRVYCVCDVLVRVLSFGSLTGALIANPDAPNGLAVLPIATLFFNRCCIMSALFISRGFIYPPEPPATRDQSKVWHKLLFGIFPAGFVQTFTDFPFNGDLATNKAFFIGHQLLSLSEGAVCALLAFVACDLPNQLTAAWPASILLGCWGIAWLSKLAAFPFYYSVRLGHNHSAAMHKSGDEADKDVRMAEVKQQHEVFVTEALFALYVKSECPECREAERILDERGQGNALRNLDDYAGTERQDLIEHLNQFGVDGRIRLPLIFYKQEFLGHAPNLKKLVEELGPEQQTSDGDDFFTV